MATPRSPRPLLRAHHHLNPHRTQQRTFLPNFPSQFNPLAPQQPHTLTETRTLPYPSHPIYAIISDVSSYSSFLPYCQSSTVTRWSAPDATYQRRWPSEGKLTVGWGNITESFMSRVFCVPSRVVESIGGDTETALARGDIAHHLQDGEQRVKGASNGLLTHLRSRWTIEPLSAKSTKVTLALEFAFANPIYMALSAGAAPKVAENMVRAFEERVRTLLDGNPDMLNASLQHFEGSKVER